MSGVLQKLLTNQFHGSKDSKSCHVIITINCRLCKSSYQLILEANKPLGCSFLRNVSSKINGHGTFCGRTRTTLMWMVGLTHIITVIGLQKTHINVWNAGTLFPCNGLVRLYCYIHFVSIFFRRAQRRRSYDMLLHTGQRYESLLKQSVIPAFQTRQCVSKTVLI